MIELADLSSLESRWKSFEGTGEVKGGRLFEAVNSGTRKAIMVLLADRGPMKAAQISRELGLSPPSVLKHISLLREVGLIKEVQPPGGARSRIEKYLDIAIPFFYTSEIHRLSKLLADLIERMSSSIEHGYGRVIRLFEAELAKLALSKKKANIDPDDIRLSLYTGLTVLIQRRLMERGVLPDIFKRVERPWSFYLIIEDEEEELRK